MIDHRKYDPVMTSISDDTCLTFKSTNRSTSVKSFFRSQVVFELRRKMRAKWRKKRMRRLKRKRRKMRARSK
ncbi:ribosomal protein L41 [Haematobia irritans]|uniref:ribosomal protein L41 n=1 Tax=Haematobia irritans TaxID=7368 RepID=UPI003F4FAC25